MTKFEEFWARGNDVKNAVRYTVVTHKFRSHLGTCMINKSVIHHDIF